jgi:hypothetical protein
VWADGSKVPRPNAQRLGTQFLSLRCVTRRAQVVLNGLAPGVHTLSAVALDLAGNTDPSPAVHTFVVPHAKDSWEAAAQRNSAAFSQPGHPVRPVALPRSLGTKKESLAFVLC